MNSGKARSSADPNPYESPAYEGDRIQFTGPWHVDGRYLVIRSRTNLPSRCVLTNRPTTDENMIKHRLNWAPLFAFVSRRGRCTVHYALSRKIRKRHTFIRWLPSFLLIGFIILIVLLSLESHPLTRSPGLGVLMFFVLGISIQFARGFGPIEINKMRGDAVWLKGCCREYLEQCDREADENTDERFPWPL